MCETNQNENSISSEKLNNIWNYFLSLEQDLANTSRYVEPAGQEEVYSFEFAKLLILACTEIESIFKIICNNLENETIADICVYKGVMLTHFPKIVEAEVTIDRLGRTVKPFSEWESHSLSWWTAYNEVKHDRGKKFKQATYWHAAMAMAALYLLVFYLYHCAQVDFYSDYKSAYFSCDYSSEMYLAKQRKPLPIR